MPDEILTNNYKPRPKETVILENTIFSYIDVFLQLSFIIPHGIASGNI